MPTQAHAKRITDNRDGTFSVEIAVELQGFGSIEFGPVKVEARNYSEAADKCRQMLATQANELVKQLTSATWV